MLLNYVKNHEFKEVIITACKEVVMTVYKYWEYMFLYMYHSVNIIG